MKTRLNVFISLAIPIHQRVPCIAPKPPRTLPSTTTPMFQEIFLREPQEIASGQLHIYHVSEWYSVFWHSSHDIAHVCVLPLPIE
ncbi:uncharacterized protein BO95DRAFT_117929 [Aspergillus brunneoviolaceus CBS 621.78]|uniref:Uncharacterized protein n=1 Tax=Aspergillus brunneoviolaceus CBS 621.78 TaxID=1450534 RepID=A0ACD1GPI2_9EURO|nr:hypothetical protein BO95DRAFT_117929 [Aspergillus brunneoviolaceus CBS 621.78]RAH50971.1 hypothetical protein BO95DRAFT_117929 [Aspergillus brunneoviolaceus CBS 621.78]